MRGAAQRNHQGPSRPWARLVGKLLLSFLIGVTIGFLICFSLAQSFSSFSLA